MRVVCDTGPLLAAANVRDEAHSLAAELVTELGRDLVVPDPVVVEVDHLLRARVGPHAARLFLEALAAGEHAVAFMTASTFRRAVELDDQFADVGVGFADAAVMTLAERDRLPILTFDFPHFRATRPRRGFWRLVLDEDRYARAVGR